MTKGSKVSPRPLPTSQLATGLAASSLAATLGDTVSLRVIAEPAEGEVLAGLQGRLRVDPRRLRYIGQPLAGAVLVLVNPDAAEQGELRVVSLRLEVRRVPNQPQRLEVEVTKSRLGRAQAAPVRLDLGGAA